MNSHCAHRLTLDPVIHLIAVMNKLHRALVKHGTCRGWLACCLRHTVSATYVCHRGLKRQLLRKYGRRLRLTYERTSRRAGESICLVSASYWLPNHRYSKAQQNSLDRNRCSCMYQRDNVQTQPQPCLQVQGTKTSAAGLSVVLSDRLSKQFPNMQLGSGMSHFTAVRDQVQGAEDINPIKLAQRYGLVAHMQSEQPG